MPSRGRLVSIHYDRGVGIPSSVRSSAASSPEPDPQQSLVLPPLRVTSFPSFHEDDWLKGGGGFASRIGRARFLVMMIMVLPLSLGAWVISNNRLYDVSFIFAQDGRVRVKRRSLFRVEPQPPIPEQQEEPLQLQQQQQPILFITTPAQTVQQQNLSPVVAKVKTVPGKRGATLRTESKSPKTSTAKKVTPHAMQVTMEKPKIPESTASATETRGFFSAIRLKHRSRTIAPIDTPPAPSSDKPTAPSSSDPGTGFFRRIRLRRRSADEKRQATTQGPNASPVAVVAVASPVEKTAGIQRGGILGLFSGIRISRHQKEEVPDPLLPVVEIRLRTKYQPQGSRGVTLRQPGIRKQRAEEARLRVLQEEEDKRMALKSEQERIREAKLVQKQSFRDMVKEEVAKRMEARRDAAAIRITMEMDAKYEAAQAKLEARNAKLAAQAKLDATTSTAKARSKKVVEQDCTQILQAANSGEATGIWRRIRLRQRSGAEKACMASTKKKIATPEKEISLQTKSWWRPIRFRRRPKEPAAPADTIADQSAAKSLKVDVPKKEIPSIKTETPPKLQQVVKAEGGRKDQPHTKTDTPRKDTPSYKADASKKVNVGFSKSSGGIVVKRRPKKTPPDEGRCFMSGVTSVFCSKSPEVANPLVEKNAPENVLPQLLKFFTGGPEVQESGRSRARSIRETIPVPQEPVAPEPKYATFRIRSKPPKPKRPPAVRIRRVRRQ